MFKKLKIVICIFFTLSSCLIIGQTENDKLISPNGDTITINAISLAEIPNNLETATAKIKKIEDKLLPTGDLLKFDSVYQHLNMEVERRKTNFEKVDDYYSLINLENDFLEWAGLKDALSNWKELINERVTVLQADLFEIQTMKAIWEKTFISYKDQGVPENVLSSEKDLLSKLIALERKAKKAKTEVLRKQNNITDLSISIDDVLSNLSNKKKVLQSDVFRQDSPPIWRAGDSTISYESAKKQMLNTRDETKRNLNNFYATNKKTINFHILIFFILWLGLYLLYRTSKKMEEHQDIYDYANARKILSHHSLSALILALFASIWLYPSPLPNSIGDIIQLTYLIIALYVIPNFINKKYKKVLYSLLILFFIHQLQDIFYGKLLVGRIVMFFETIFVGWVLYLILKPEKQNLEQRFKKRWGFIFKIMPVFYLFLIVALIGNIFGFVDFAILVENVVVRSLFNLIILILAVLVIDWALIVLLRTPYAQASNIIKNYTTDIEKRIFQFIKIVGIILWLRAAFHLLGLYDPIVEWFNEFIKESYKIGSTSIEIGGILTFFLVIFATVIIFRVIKSILADEVFPRVKLARGLPGSISMITGYFIAGYGFFIALGAAGVDLSSFGLIAGALGVGIGFGLQGIVANFIAGIVLAFERPIQVGDTIQLAEMYGDVLHIGVRSTTVKTYDGSEVIVPNSSLITNDVINWTLSDRKKRRDINVGVAYGSDPELVMEIIKKVANEHPEVQKIPAPWALFDGFGDSALNFRVRIWTTMDSGMTTKSDVTVAIYNALQKAGISIPFPQRDLYIKSLPEDTITNKRVLKKTAKPKPKKTDHKEEIEDFTDGDDD